MGDPTPTLTSPPQSPPPPPPATSVPPESPDSPGSIDKVLAVLGYLTGIVALVAILIDPYRGRRFVRHHALQALGLWVAILILDPALSWTVIVPVGLFVLQVLGAVRAYQGEYWRLPFIHGIVGRYI